MSKQNKCFKHMTMEEAIAWTEKNCSFADVRNRLASRQVAYMFYESLKQGSAYVANLEAELKRAMVIMEDMKVSLQKKDEKIEKLEQEFKLINLDRRGVPR